MSEKWQVCPRGPNLLIERPVDYYDCGPGRKTHVLSEVIAEVLPQKESGEQAALAQLIAEAPETKRQRDRLLDTLKDAERLAYDRTADFGEMRSRWANVIAECEEKP